MAVFNPDAGGVPSPNMPDQTGASRGQIADKSLGIALEGVGQGVAGAVNAYNDYNHWEIDKAVKGGFDEANKPFSDILPRDLSKASSTIGALQNAYDQGKLSDVYYTGQLAKLTKQLRSQYPQYEDYIDNTVQSVTGIRPANAFRNAIMQEFEKQQQASTDDEKFKRQYIKENEDYISRLFPDFFQNPDKYDFSVIRSTVANSKAQKNTLEQQLLEINTLEQTKKLTTEQAQEAAATSLGYTVQSSMTSLTNTLGISGDDLFKKIQDMSTKGFSPQEYQAVMGQLGQYQTNMKLALTKQMYAPTNPSDPASKSLFAILGADEAQKQIDAAMAPIDSIVKYATDQNWGLATYYLNLNKVAQDKTLATIMNASPELRVANALGSVDRTMAENWLAEAGHQEGIFAQITPEVVANIAADNDTFNGAATRMATSSYSDVEKSSGINALIDANKATITSGNATPEQFKNAVMNTYGLDKNGDDIFKFIQPDEYNSLYRTMFSSDVTNAIVKSGDRDLIEEYFMSAEDHIYAAPDFTKAAKQIQDTQDWDKAATISFAPGSNVLVMSVDPTKLAPLSNEKLGLPNWMRNDEIKRGRDAIDTLNSVFATLTPMMDGLKMSPEEQSVFLENVVKKLSVDLTQSKKQGFFDWLLTGFQNATDQVDPNKGIADAVNPPDNLDFNFPTDTSGVPQSYIDKVSGAESNNNPNAANPNSTATGRFQFLDSTAKSYMNRLGLTGDKNSDENQIAMLNAYTQDSTNELNKRGIPVTDANLYTMHVLGQYGGGEVLSAPDSEMLTDLLPGKVFTANPQFKKMTVGDFKRWAKKTIG